VQGYIDAAHARGMKTLFYNLGYGALEDYETDGVSREWLLYLDRIHRNPDFHPLGSPFKSSIYLVNTANEEWREYLSDRNDEVYAVFDFDGWQIDQLGDRLVPVYDYAGNPVDLAGTFGSFITYMKQQQPEKRLVMNAVGQYGQQGQIAAAPVDFCYTEIWQHSDVNGYDIFRDIITNNAAWSNGKQTVLAAYLNYDYGTKGRGYFNTPGIIMATAVATAWGGTILQMGEHMLCNEYFPGDNLAMTGELKRAMINYYDFAVAYENILRPDVPAAGINTDWFGVDVTADTVAFNQWAPQKDQIATVGRHVGNDDIIHLLSYRNATHLDWCDTNGDQGEPDRLDNLAVRVAAAVQPNRVWFASPDYAQGAAIELEFTYAGGQVELTLPSMKYYSMLVFEY
jgi:dextranase